MSEQDYASGLRLRCWNDVSRVTIENAREFVAGVEQRVPLVDGRFTRYVNLDNAATSPPFSPILDASREFFDYYASIHRGSGFKSFASTRIYEHCRQIVADFVGADLSYHTLIFTQNATHALNKLAAHLCPPAGHFVLTTTMEHHSNILPWRKVGAQVEYVGIDREQGTLDLDDLEKKLSSRAGRLGLVTVTGASNVTGVMPPIREIARLAHDRGAMVAVDATQLIPHRSFRMGGQDDPERIDFIAFSGHKMYAPFGAGVLVGPRTAFEARPPDVQGGGTVKAVTQDEVIWASVPEKEEAGTPNAFGVFALSCAVKMLDSIGMENVAEHENGLARMAMERLARIDGLRVYGLKAPMLNHDSLGIIAFNAADIDHAQLAVALGYEWGIGVRSGCFCAQPYVRELLGISENEMVSLLRKLAAGGHTSVPGMVRASFGVYNVAEEVDHLCEALTSIVKHGPRSRYVLDKQHMDLVPPAGSVDLYDYLPL